MSVKDSESRRFEITLAEFVSARSWPNVCPGNVFFCFFFMFETFFLKICPHSERYRITVAGIFETQSSFWQNRVSRVIGLSVLIQHETT